MTRLASKLIVGGLLVGWFVLFHPGHDVRAQSSTLPDDFVCRECHGDATRSHVFPSGEAVSIGVDLTTLDGSPHSSSAATPVGCNNCHVGRERYLFPHQTNPAQTQQDFAVEVSENCESCHYAHKPFHLGEEIDLDDLEQPLPVCADCHGGHDIVHVDQIPEQMPDRCLACHTDQNREWVDLFLSPISGLGEGQDGYGGSARCYGCHEDKFTSWQDTLHARLIQNVETNPEAVLANFESTDAEMLPFGPEDISYTIGNRWRQAYLTHAATQAMTGTQPLTGTLAVPPSMDSSLTLLPMQWLVEDEAWIPLEEGGELPEEWISECGSCHVTGLDTETWGFVEFGIGCESCHGPGEAHAKDPTNVKPFAAVDDQVCGSCHSRGTSPDGYPFPATYHPGEPLAEHFTFTDNEEFFWPDGSARDNHQQFMDWTLGNSMAASGKVNCTTCHLVHDSGEAIGQLREPLNNLCLECHNAQRALVQHTPFHQQAMRTRSFQCTDCHMPKIVSSSTQDVGTEFVLHSHAFQQPNPSATIEHGGLEFMPNSCNVCHDQLAEDPAWAQETIRFSRASAASTSFFGPGPTPTSPPPPTPIAAVGEAPEEIVIEPPFGWLRTAVFVMVGLIVALGVALLVNSLVRRRELDA